MTENPDKRIELAMADTRETLGRSDMSGVIVTGAGSRLHLCQTCLNLLNKVSPGLNESSFRADIDVLTLPSNQLEVTSTY
jgi:hypothetical protein